MLKSLKNPLDQVSDPVERSRLRLRLLLAGGIFAMVGLCSLVILVGTALQSAQRQPERDRLQALAPLRQLCTDGAGLATAAAYAPEAGPGRVVVFVSTTLDLDGRGTYYNRSEDYPADWQAAAPEEVGLVACVQMRSVVVEQCDYTLTSGAQATLQRAQSVADITLYAARTGAVVGQDQLIGAEPRACQDQEQFTEGVNVQAVTGDAVPPAQLADWLRAFIGS